MNKDVEFDKKFSYASMDMHDNKTSDEDEKNMIKHNSIRDTQSGKTDKLAENKTNLMNNTINLNCDKENKIIKEQYDQTLFLIDIINAYQKESRIHKQKEELYNTTCKKSDELKRTLNIVVMIFILIMIIIMLYINKHRIV